MRTKEDIVQAIARKLVLPINITDAVVTAFMNEISESLINGETVQLRRFGVFEPKELAAKAIASPQTGSRLELPKRKSAKFKPSTTLRRLIEGEQDES